MVPVMILVMDNDQDAGEELRRLPRHRGAPYQLILTDLLMPRLDGLGLLERLKEVCLCLPVLLITACGDWGSYAWAMELGAAAYLIKPFRSEELLQEGQRVLGRAGDEAVGPAPSRS